MKIVLGQAARVNGPLITSNGQTQTNCLSFWYHMYGNDMGQLNVYMKTRPYLSNPLWLRKGHQANRWLNALVELNTDVDYQVEFKCIFHTFCCYVSGSGASIS